MNKKVFMRCFSMAMVVCVVLLFAGCGAEILTVTAVRGGLEAQQAKQAVKQLDYVKGKVGNINVDQAVQAYFADKGVYPPSLDALVPSYLPAVPTQADGSPYAYDPSTGRIATGAAGITAEDTQLMNEIRAAIPRYGTATGYYPPTLDDLYPQYLSKLPRTSSGAPFVYNNQNGSVSHPNGGAPSVAASARPTRSMPVGGGSGPMGEVMTGIGIQQELGRMNTSGASAAQSRARSGVSDIGNQQTNTQNRVMDQLGL